MISFLSINSNLWAL